jgi:hypothetical protein
VSIYRVHQACRGCPVIEVYLGLQGLEAFEENQDHLVLKVIG